MPTKSYAQLAPNSTGEKMDVCQVTVSGTVVDRQDIVIADPNAPGAEALVANAQPGATSYGLAVWQVGATPLPTAASKLKARNLAATVTAVKASAGTLFSLVLINTSAAAAFVQVFDALIGNVTLGTTTPDLEFLVPATSGQVTFSFPDQGVAFATGISIASTTLEAGSVGSAAGVQVFAVYV